MGHHKDDDQVEEQDAGEQGPPRDEDGGLILPPTVEPTIGFEGSIEGL